MAALVANRQRDHHENDCCRRARGSRRMTSDARDHVTQQVRSPVNHSLFVCLSLSHQSTPTTWTIYIIVIEALMCEDKRCSL